MERVKMDAQSGLMYWVPWTLKVTSVLSGLLEKPLTINK